MTSFLSLERIVGLKSAIAPRRTAINGNRPTRTQISLRHPLRDRTQI
ncbi:MAG: hypothetical protein QNJ53_12570 [Pleurocapsa sp. MO_192.B19]|nr:hypothetical protein [Pleurocapsa sp. MO_192.B19]